MKAIPEILNKMEDISGKLAQWEISVDVLMQLENFPMSVSVTNEEGEIEAVNKAFCEMSGYEEQEIIGEFFIILYPENQKTYYLEMHQKFMHTPFNSSGEYQMVDKNGQKKDVLASVSLLEVEGDKKRVTLSLEVTDQLLDKKQEIDKLTDLNAFIKRINESITDHASKLISQETAAGIVRHDLKNQLHNIVSLSKLLSKHDLPKEEQKEFLHKITSSAESALNELEQNRSIELMERGNYQLDIEEFDLMEMLDKIRDKLEIYFSSKEIKLLVQSDNPKHVGNEREPYQIQADKLFIEMLLTNLLQNAAEASPENETVLVDISTITMMVEISIHNWGTVPQEIQKRFFEKYVTRGKRKGTGLGTYICKMIVEAHEGMINMESNDARGTYVVFAIPLQSFIQKQNNKAA